MRFFFFVLFTCIITKAGSSQEIRLLVKKGIITYNNKVIKPSDGIIIIQSPASVKVNPGALVFAKKNAVIQELLSGREYKYEELKKMFGGSKGFTKSYLSVLTSQDYSIKVQYGKSIRGKEDDPLWYTPIDSATILSDSVTLTTGGKTSTLLTDIQLFGTGIKDTIYLSKENRMYKIKTPLPGSYYWNYDSEYITIRSFKNYFIVPTAEKKEILRKAFQEYLDTIRNFSEEMQAYLIEEYCYLQKIHISN